MMVVRQEGTAQDDRMVTRALATVIGSGFALLLTLVWYGHSAELDRAFAAREFSESMRATGDVSTSGQKILFLQYGALNRSSATILPAIEKELQLELERFEKALSLLRTESHSPSIPLSTRGQAASIFSDGMAFAKLVTELGAAGQPAKSDLSQLVALSAKIDKALGTLAADLAKASVSYAILEDQRRDQIFWFTLGLIASIGLLVLAFVAARVRSELSLRRLTEQRLIKANAELDHFSSIVAHDLNGPLANISIAAQLLGKSKAANSTASAEVTELLQGQTRRLHDMVGGLLQLSRIGRDPLKRKIVDLVSLVEEERILSKDRFAEARADISMSGDRSIWGDVGLFKQLIHHLLDNSCKYRSVDRPLQVTFDVETLENTSILRYQDNGQGIPAENHESVFQPFFQCRTDSPSTEIGLGLSVVKKIVGLHCGEIKIVENDLPGVCFEIRIPYRPNLTRQPLKKLSDYIPSVSTALRRSAVVNRLLG